MFIVVKTRHKNLQKLKKRGGGGDKAKLGLALEKKAGLKKKKNTVVET